MKIIILSAGRGTRMLPLTANTPKCLLELANGISVLESQLNTIKKNPEIDEVVLVLGYLAEQVEAKIIKYRKEMNIRVVYNPFYDISNNLISLWTASHEMGRDFIILNGDDVFHSNVLGRLTDIKEEGIFLVISRKDGYKQEDMKVLLENGNIIRVSKKIDPKKSHGESIGMIKIAGEKARKHFMDALSSIVRTHEGREIFYLEVFNRLAENNFPIRPVEVNDADWAEIDFHPDLDSIKKNIENYFGKPEFTGRK